MATLRDVAQRAHVSPQTVSNVVHGKTSEVSAETIARVQAAIDALGYQPSHAARFLRGGHGRIIALVVPDLINPYFALISMQVITAAQAQDYTVLIHHTGGERDAELRALEALRPHMLDGAIISPLALDMDDIKAHAAGIPIVLLGERCYPMDTLYDHVVIDNVAAARALTAHLLEHGRRRIAVVGLLKNAGEEMSRLRLQGYMDAMAAAGQPVDPALILPSPNNSLHRSDGVIAMRHLLGLAEPPDAVFCFNDLVALGALTVLHERGYDVPADMALVGFDDIEEARFSFPALTTVYPATEEVCKLAVELLLARINGSRIGPPERVQPGFTLMVRASTVGGSPSAMRATSADTTAPTAGFAASKAV